METLTQQVIEGNRLIAEFMGLPTDDDDHSEDWFNNVFKYHISWDWLMPVVQKIKQVTSYDRGDIFGTEVIISNYCKIKSEHYQIPGKTYYPNEYFDKCFQQDTLIETVWYACVQYIKWYNSKN